MIIRCGFRSRIGTCARTGLRTQTALSAERCRTLQCVSASVAFKRLRSCATLGNRKSGGSEPDPEILQEDGEEIFSEARDTERDDTTTEYFETYNTSASADTARDSTAVRPVRADKRPTTSRTSSFGDGGERWAGRQRGAVRAGSDGEEWCTGHVCLRLRPVGLKESTAGGQEEEEEEDVEDSEENSSCTSGAESEAHRGHEVWQQRSVLGLPHRAKRGRHPLYLFGVASDLMICLRRLRYGDHI